MATRTRSLLLWATLAAVLAEAGEEPADRRLRIDIDITGDGRAEVLLTWASEYEKAGQPWTILLSDGDRLRPLGVFDFNPAMGFRVEAEQRRIVVIEPVSVGLSQRVEYTWSAAGVRETDRRWLEDRGSEQETGQGVERAELAAIREYWRKARPLESFAHAGDELDGEPVWRDPETGRPRNGLRKVTQPGTTVVAPPRLTVAEHFAETRRCSPVPSCEVWLVELDLTGDGQREVLLGSSATASQLGWLVYVPGPGGFTMAGSLPLEPLGFRFDAESGELVVTNERERQIERYRVSASGVSRTAVESWRENFGAIGRPELDRAAAWRAGQAGHILRSPLAGFPAGPWTSWITGEPAAARASLARLVLNP